MIFISIKIFVFLILCAAGCVAGVGIYSYNLFTAVGEKSTAELMLFISLCVELVMCAGFFSAIAYSGKKRRELSRITKMARVNGVIAAQRFSKFGSFGRQLQSLFEDILQISEMRSVRIAYLNNTVTAVCNNMSVPILIVDITGSIQYVSNGYIKKVSDREKSIVGLHLLDVYPEINFEEVLLKTEKSGSEHTVKTEKHIFKFLPVFSKDNTPAGVLVHVEKNSLLAQSSSAVKQLYSSVTQKDGTESEEKTVDRQEAETPAPNKVAALKSRFFGRFGKKKE